jgi:transposase
MLKMEEFLTLRDLYNQGMSISAISRMTGYDRRTVKKYATATTPPVPKKRAKRPSKLDPYKEYITQRLSEYPLTATRIYREIQERGYTGKYSIVKDFVKTVRQGTGVPAVYRYETKPGVQAQVDWGECGHIEIDGAPRKLYCFTMILGYSRMRYVEFTLHVDVYTLIQCHLNAFQYFGGYPAEVLYDNMKQVVIKRALKPSDSTWNPKFEDFFTYYGFIPRLCRPYRPQTKGKIENTVGFVKRDFFLGGIFSSFSDLNSQVQGWMKRVNSTTHGTTNEIPIERLKQEELKRIGGIPPYQNFREETRRISEDAYISYLGNRYSVPYKYAGREARLQIQDRAFSVTVGSEKVCSHEIIPGRGRVSRNKEHFEGFLSEVLKQNSTQMNKPQTILRFKEPDVEKRSLSVYDSFSEGGNAHEPS